MIDEIDGIDEFDEDLEVAGEDDDDIVTLVNENGASVDFVEIAGIAHKGHF